MTKLAPPSRALPTTWKTLFLIRARAKTNGQTKANEIDKLKDSLGELAAMMYVLSGKHGDMKEKIVKYLSDGDRKRLERAVEEQDEV